MTLMTKSTLNFGHSQTHDPVRAKAMGVGLPIVLIIPSFGLSLFVMVSLVPGTMAQGHTCTPPIIQQQLGALFPTSTGPACGN